MKGFKVSAAAHSAGGLKLNPRLLRLLFFMAFSVAWSVPAHALADAIFPCISQSGVYQR